VPGDGIHQTAFTMMSDAPRGMDGKLREIILKTAAYIGRDGHDGALPLSALPFASA